MKNAIIALLAISVIGLGAYTVKLKRQIAEPVEGPQTEEATPEAEREVRPVQKPEDADLLEVEADDPAGPVPDPQLKKANELITALYQQNESLEKDAEPSFAKGLAQMMESPEFQGMARQGIERNIKNSHAGLFRWLNLDSDKEAALTELLIERNMAEIPNGINWMMGNFEESAESMIAAREEMYAQVKELLGEEQLETYKYWEESKNEREAVQRFNYARGEEEKLGDDTSDRLVEMMYTERGKFEELDHLSRPENFDPREMDEERRTDIMGQVEELHEVFVQKAGPILDEKTLPKYEENLGRQRQQLKGFMEFSHGIASRASEAGQAGSPAPQADPDAVKLR